MFDVCYSLNETDHAFIRMDDLPDPLDPRPLLFDLPL